MCYLRNPAVGRTKQNGSCKGQEDEIKDFPPQERKGLCIFHRKKKTNRCMLVLRVRIIIETRF